MEILGDWFLIYRSPALLKQVGVSAGFKINDIDIDKEELGINLFVRYESCEKTVAANGAVIKSATSSS